MQRILEYKFYWGGWGGYRGQKFDTDWGKLIYPHGSKSNPCNRFEAGRNDAVLEDTPGIRYNPLQALIYGKPRFLHVKGVTCAVCISGPENYVTSERLTGNDAYSYSLDSVTMYGCIEWEFTIAGRNARMIQKSITPVPCQHASFLGEYSRESPAFPPSTIYE